MAYMGELKRWNGSEWEQVNPKEVDVRDIYISMMKYSEKIGHMKGFVQGVVVTGVIIGLIKLFIFLWR